MRVSIYISILFWVIFCDFSFPQTRIEQGAPFYQHYSQKDYYGSTQIWCSVQDNRGMMYFGDVTGIMGFNGSDWNRIEVSNNSIVRSLAVDKNGRVYVGASNEFGYLQPNKSGNMEYISLSQTLQNKNICFLDVWRTNVTDKGVYFFTSNYIFRYYKNKLSTTKTELAELRTYQVDNKIFYFAKEGLREIRNGVTFNLNKNIYFSGLTSYTDNNLLVAEYNGELRVYDQAFTKFTKLKTQAQQFLNKHHIVNIKRIDNDKFAVITNSGGIVLLTNAGEPLQIINKVRGLLNSTIYSVFVDKDNNLWVCHSKGLSKFDINFPFLKFDYLESINNIVQSTFVNESIRYIGTIDGIFYSPLKTLKSFEEDNSFKKIEELTYECWDFRVMNHHLMAVCGSGVWLIRGDKAKCIYQVDTKQSAHCFCTSKKFPDVLFVGMRGVLTSLKIKDNSNYQDVKVIEEFSFPEITEKVRRITSDKNGNLWINTQFNGIYFVRFLDNNIKHYKITHIGQSNGLSYLSNTHTFLTNGEISITSENGILKPEFPKEGLPDSLVQLKYTSVFGDRIKNGMIHILQVSKNNYLLIGEYIYKTKTDGQTLSFDTCGFNRLNNNYIITNSELNEDGTISFCGNDSYFIYDPKAKRDYKKPFHSIITGVEIGKDSLLFGGNFPQRVNAELVSSTIQPKSFIATLGYKYNSVIIHYSALFYEEPKETKYQYQLVGYDKSWSNWTNDVKAVYTNLPERKYTFKVRALNVYGTISDTAEYRFKISPPTYRTWWAILLYALLFIGLIYLLVKFYTRILLKQKDNLELIVKTRTEELRRTNEQLVQKEKFKQDVSSMIVHDLKNPINSIINGTESNPETQLIRAKQIGRRMLNLVLNILDVYKYEEAQIVLYPINHQLFDLAEKAIDQILYLCVEKNITISNRINQEFEVHAETEIIERVFINILTNSIKYTPNNGLIILDAKKDSIKGFVKIAVIDNGTGIEKDKIHLIFEKFGQANIKNSGLVRSTGLGLAYCKLVVEAHGGKIDVESVYGKGSEFWFTLPLSKISTKDIHKTASEVSHGMDSLSISQESKSILKSYIIELQNIDIYKITEITLILDRIDSSLNNEIKLWKQSLEDAIYAGNETLYKRLLDI